MLWEHYNIGRGMRGIICMLVLLIAVGCHRDHPKPSQTVYPVDIGKAVERDVPIYIEAIGNVYSPQLVQIRPQVGGIIQEAYFKQGDYVKKGEPLYRIDPRPYQAALDKAKATLLKDQATVEYNEVRVKRYAELVKQDFISKLNYDQYKSELDTSKGQVLSDQADIVTAELNLEWCTPIAPITGKISLYNIYVGNLVIANDSSALTNIRQISPVDIRFTINQTDFIEVQTAKKKGQLKFEVLLPQDTQNPREGELYFTDNTLDLTTGTILLIGTVPNDDEFLWPGEFVRIRLQLRTHPKAVLVPEESVRMGQQGPFVYLYNPENSTVDYRLVKKGQKYGQLVMIEEGVAAGDSVVTLGQINLRPGAKVRIVTD